jgi:hypothetical protein
MMRDHVPCPIQARMTEESRRMVKDVDERLGSSVQDLRELIVSGLQLCACRLLCYD